MNKYQEAFETICGIALYKPPKPRKDGWIEHSHAQIKYIKEFDIIEELIEKSIPKKQIDNRCPNCNSINIFYRKKEDSDWLVHNKYCPDCGQANEWIIDDTNR